MKTVNKQDIIRLVETIEFDLKRENDYIITGLSSLVLVGILEECNVITIVLKNKKSYFNLVNRRIYNWTKGEANGHRILTSTNAVGYDCTVVCILDPDSNISTMKIDGCIVQSYEDMLKEYEDMPMTQNIIKNFIKDGKNFFDENSLPDNVTCEWKVDPEIYITHESRPILETEDRRYISMLINSGLVRRILVMRPEHMSYNKYIIFLNNRMNREEATNVVSRIYSKIANSELTNEEWDIVDEIAEDGVDYDNIVFEIDISYCRQSICNDDKEEYMLQMIKKLRREEKRLSKLIDELTEYVYVEIRHKEKEKEAE